MNDENHAILAKAVGIAGDILQPKLPPSSRHPEGRNAYAHIWVCIRNRFGNTRQIPDEMLNEVFAYIEYLVQNPF